ncbi:uncharacterized protein VTP21DRAFT_4872 [Calcarisporiella thermophila]|uniref:uncharacterized protein n=1 Tax=Calcarisporiella thermophila TaxID=911321 RepID=UPI0037425204
MNTTIVRPPTDPEPSEHTLPSVLHFLQSEWRRFERERHEWELERTEMKARIAALEGERRGMENLKNALMRRIKMLEVALMQERKKYVSSGTSSSADETTVIMSDPNRAADTSTTQNASEDLSALASKALAEAKELSKSREYLKMCLNEITHLSNAALDTTNSLKNWRTGGIWMGTAGHSREPAVSDVFLSPHTVDAVHLSETHLGQNQPGAGGIMSATDLSPSAITGKPSPSIDEGTKLAQAEKGTVDTGSMKGAEEDEEEGVSEEQLIQDVQSNFQLSPESIRKIMARSENTEARPKLQVDELANLTITAEEAEGQPAKPSVEKDIVDTKVWRSKLVLRNHLDVVRSVSFHPSEPILASASDDSTVKIWNLRRYATSGNKRSASQDLEPAITFRGHTGMVTSVIISGNQGRCYSGSVDSTIRVWRLPSMDRGAYTSYDPSLQITTYVGHTDAIWDIRAFPIHVEGRPYLIASASADGTVKLWDTNAEKSPLRSSILYAQDTNSPVPTSIEFCHTDLKKILVAYSNSVIKMFDLETSQCVSTFESASTYDGTPATQINRIVSHHTMPLVLSGHEDKYIRFFDVNTGSCTHSMPAHLDSVTSLDIEPAGSVFVSGGHDASIRFWDLATYTCVQEFTSHRRKGDEGVMSLHYHPTRPWLASAGSDAVVKLYQPGD